MTNKKVLVTETFNGITFCNFPAEEYMHDLCFSMHDEALAEKISTLINECVPAGYRAGIKVDCAKIKEFDQNIDEEPTPNELRVSQRFGEFLKKVSDNSNTEG